MHWILVLILMGFASADAAFSAHGETGLFQALFRERFGNISDLSFSGFDSTGWNYSGSADISAAMGPYLLTVQKPSRGMEGPGMPSGPFSLFLTRAFDKTVLSSGLGYNFSENASSAAQSANAGIGPGIPPFIAVDTVWKESLCVEWTRKHSFFANINGLHYFSARCAVVAGVQAFYMLPRGFRYEQLYLNDPQELSVRYYDFNKDAWQAGISLALGLRHVPTRLPLPLSTLMSIRWDFDYKKSVPAPQTPMHAYGYSNVNYPDPTIEYIGKACPSHRLILEYSISDVNPVKAILTFTQKKIFRAPLLAINDLSINAQYSQKNETSTYVNQWVRDGTVGYGTTYHKDNTYQIEAGGRYDIRCCFLRNFYVQAIGRGTVPISYSRQSSGDGDWESQGAYGGGTRFCVFKRLLVDLGISGVSYCVGRYNNDYSVTTKTGFIGFHASLWLIDTKLP
jgi:hypothetical protein